MRKTNLTGFLLRLKSKHLIIIIFSKVLEDITLEGTQQKDTNADVVWLRSFLESNSRALAYDGRQFYAKLNQHSGSCKLRDKWKSAIEKPPVPSLIALTLNESDTGT